jgi:hypothetical protein
MKNLKNVLIGLIATISLTSVAYAGSFGLGLTGSNTKINGSGTESDAANTGTESSVRTKSVDNDAILGSVYAEYSFDDASWGAAGNGITFGASYTPGSADVSDKVLSRTDTAVGKGGAGDSSGSVTYKAQAEVENYQNFYVEVPLWKSIYVKAGMSQIDVNTKESGSSTTGTYGNTSLDGTNLGIGLKGVTSSNIVWKLAYEETDFDTLNLTSSTSNTIKADLDTEAVSLSIGYRF